MNLSLALCNLNILSSLKFFIANGETLALPQSYSCNLWHMSTLDWDLPFESACFPKQLCKESILLNPNPVDRVLCYLVQSGIS